MCVMTFYGCLLLIMVLQMFNTLEQTIEIEGLFTREREREREKNDLYDRNTIIVYFVCSIFENIMFISSFSLLGA